MAAPQAKADVDPNFSSQIKSLQAQNAANATAIVQGQQGQWMMPVLESASENGGEWSGDLFDLEGIGEAFDRSQANQWFTDAISDSTNPGTSGDQVVCQMQVDYLAMMERSFRSRHTMSGPRAVMHAMGRRAGHGSDSGPLIQSVLEVVRSLVKESKGGGKS